MDIVTECRRLIAHYLEANGFEQTLSAFNSEAKLDGDPQAASPSISSSFNIQSLVQTWLDRQHEEALTSQFATVSLSGTSAGPSAGQTNEPFDWYSDLPLSAIPKTVTQTLRDVHLAGVLSVNYCLLPRRIFDTSTVSYRSEKIPCIVTTSTDKRIAFTSTETWTLEDEYQMKAVTLSVKTSDTYPWLMLSGAMDGSVTVTDLLTREQSIMKEHSKYVVRVAWSPDGRWFCTAGYDRTLCIYEAVQLPLDASSGSAELDDDEFAKIPRFAFPLRWKKTFPSNPEACVFLPDSQYLAFTRRDDNHLNYVRLPSPSDSAAERDYPDDAWAITRYNLNETLDSHISFCILSLAIHPSKQAITLQTDTPISRIILLPFHSEERLRQTLYTSAEQSEFSNPRHAWLPGGAGVAVSSDDGILRVVDLEGKIRSRISAHGLAAPQDDEAIPGTGPASERLRAAYQSDRGSSVIRDLCVVPGPSPAVVSVGLDRTIRVSHI